METNIKTNGIAMIINGIKEVLNGLDAAEDIIDAPENEALYVEVWEMFPKFVKAILKYKYFVLWCDEDIANVHILDTDKESAEWVKTGADIIKEHPNPDTDNPKQDEFIRKCRFCREISLEQFTELAAEDFTNPSYYNVTECGLEYSFPLNDRVIEARFNGKI